jgi:hypothetical protein
MDLRKMSFEELVDYGTTKMTHELFKGTPWRSTLWEVMELTLRWKELQNYKKPKINK